MTDLDKLLRFDPLDMAEKLTGVSIHDEADKSSVVLGLAIAQEHASAKNRALLESNDTTLCNKLARYVLIITAFGFEEVLIDKWKSSWGHDEQLSIYAHRKGLLLSFDSYNGENVSGGNVYYNWRPTVSLDEAGDCTSSGGYANFDTDPVWVGGHDCREAIIHNLNKLNNRGEFVTPWVKRPFLWLLHYDEPKVQGYDYRAISEARIRRLPSWVQDFIGPETRGK